MLTIYPRLHTIKLHRSRICTHAFKELGRSVSIPRYLRVLIITHCWKLNDAAVMMWLYRCRTLSHIEIGDCPHVTCDAFMPVKNCPPPANPWDRDAQEWPLARVAYGDAKRDAPGGGGEDRLFGYWWPNEGCRHMIGIALGWCNITTLNPIILNGGKTLEDLDLHGCRCAVPSDLIGVLSSLPNLRTLGIAETNLGTPPIIEACAAMNLKVLDISSPIGGGDRCPFMYRALGRSKSIEKLYMDNCISLTNECLRAVFRPALLRVVSLRGCWRVSEGAFQRMDLRELKLVEADGVGIQSKFDLEKAVYSSGARDFKVVYRGPSHDKNGGIFPIWALPH
eukprot:GHVO01056794.1.p1 GENE.GHVO01056794.1~~GHVO01056794.1.p1  ORF type:complete len:337 (+),score=67.04 GHVO01056794.1:630-1640(+)